MISIYQKIEAYLVKTGASELLSELRRARRGVRVVQNYNLRWPKEPVESNDWTVFVNAKGNLAHAVLFDRPDVMVRLPGLSLKGCNEEYARSLLFSKLEGL